MADEVTDRGKMIAALSYGGFFLGFPLGIVPLVMRDDPFALEHGKHATAVWVLHFTLVMVLTFFVTAIATVTCGFGAILFPIVFAPALAGMITSIHGLVLALNGDASEPFGGMGLGNMLFSGIKVDESAVARLAAAPSKGPAAAAETGLVPDHADHTTDADGDVPPPPPAPSPVDASDVPPPPPAPPPVDASDVPPPPPAPPPVDASDPPPPPKSE